MPSFPGGYPDASTVSGSDKLLIAQGGVTKEVSVADVIAAASTAAATAATAASTAQTTANSAVAAAANAQSTANDAVDDAASAQAAAEAAQDAADAAASAAAAAAAAASSGSGTAASAASAAAAAASNATAALTAANAANTAASAAATNASAALTQSAAAQATANTALADAATAQAAADAAQADVDALEETVTLLSSSAALSEKILMGSTAGQSISSGSAVQISGMSMPVLPGRRYWFRIRFIMDQNDNTVTFSMDSTATLADIFFKDLSQVNFLANGYDVAVIHGYCEATTAGSVKAMLEVMSGTIAVLGSPIMAYREIGSGAGVGV